jgi:hypothetical protein
MATARLRQRKPMQVKSHELVSECEQRALRYTEQLDRVVSRASKQTQHHLPPIAFTITDQTYADMVDDVAKMIHRVGFPVSDFFFVCLDQASVSAVCARGHEAIFYPSKNQRTRVSEAKFGVAEKLLGAGRSFLFFEMDVWFLRSPLPYFAHPSMDLFIGLHQNNAFR